MKILLNYTSPQLHKNVPKVTDNIFSPELPEDSDKNGTNVRPSKVYAK